MHWDLVVRQCLASFKNMLCVCELTMTNSAAKATRAGGSHSDEDFISC